MSLSLNARQQALLIAVIRNMKADIDWDQVAVESDYGTAKSARDNWGHTKKRIMTSFGGDKDGARTPATGGKKATPKKRKGSDDETPSKETPSKKRYKKATAPADEDDEEGNKVLIKPEGDDDAYV